MADVIVRVDSPRLLVKRDDQTGLATGGNKVRKLEFLIAEAKQHGADTLVTSGSIQSNHCRQTAAAAARLGMNAVLLLRGEKSVAHAEGNLLIDKLVGAEVRIGSQACNECADQLRAAGRKPYISFYSTTITLRFDSSAPMPV